jgi:ABC-type Mn2+/Zn2+ transport system permease subunit
MVENVLFGNTVFVPSAQLAALGVVALLVLALHILMGRHFLTATFDRDFAAAAGVRVGLHDQLFYISLAIALAFMIGAIGVMPVFGLMVMPAATGLLLASRARAVLCWAMAAGLVTAALGFYLSFVFSWPTGPAILATGGALLGPAALISRLLARP